METDMDSIENLKYPIGRFQKPVNSDAESLEKFITEIEAFPQKLRHEVSGLTHEQLDTPYRPGGWTIRQVVHHCADSHMNAMMRVKLALTEDKPVIKPYFEALWAELPDSRLPVTPALEMIDGIHARWTHLLRSLSGSALARTFIHPEHKREIPISEVIAIYAWHCRHHLAHITALKNMRRWT